MTATATLPWLSNELSKLKKRLDAIERRLGDLLDPYQPEIVFSQSGPLAATPSMIWVRRHAGRLVEVYASLRVAGSTDTVFEVRKNDVAFLTVTIPAGQYWSDRMCAEFFSPKADRMHDVLTTIGTGAEDLTVQHWFKK